MASSITTHTGAKASPNAAAKAPRRPAKRAPMQIARFMMLGPGTIWQIPRMALNSSEVRT